MPRRKKQYHYLYKTTNVINNKFYVGTHSTNDLNDGYLGSGRYLRRSVSKYGKDKFKIEFLEFFENRVDLMKRENELVNEDLLKDPLCMNLRVGGEGGFTKKNSLKETLAMNKKLWSNPDFIERKKKHGSEIFKELHKKGKIKYGMFAGKSHSTQSKNKMRDKAELRIGKMNSQFGTCWIHNNKESKKIKIDKLELHLMDGWIKGRKMKLPL